MITIFKNNRLSQLCDSTNILSKSRHVGLSLFSKSKRYVWDSRRASVTENRPLPVFIFQRFARLVTLFDQNLPVILFCVSSKNLSSFSVSEDRPLVQKGILLRIPEEIIASCIFRGSFPVAEDTLWKESFHRYCVKTSVLTFSVSKHRCGTFSVSKHRRSPLSVSNYVGSTVPEDVSALLVAVAFFRKIGVAVDFRILSF